MLPEFCLHTAALSQLMVCGIGFSSFFKNFSLVLVRMSTFGSVLE